MKWRLNSSFFYTVMTVKRVTQNVMYLNVRKNVKVKDLRDHSDHWAIVHLLISLLSLELQVLKSTLHWIRD